MPEFELGTPNGQKYRLTVPEGASPEEIQQVAQNAIRQLTPQGATAKAAALGVPELRQQPSAFQEATNEGGIASPSNVGSIGGGIVGAAAGAPLGPAGMFLGGVGGAGVGRGVGRLGEILKRRIYGPGPQAGTAPNVSPSPTTTEDVASIGQATQRGMVEQAVGEAGGALLNKGLSRVMAPFAKRAAANQSMVQEAQRLGITELPASVQTGSPALSQAERFVSRFPLGTEAATESGERLLSQTEQAARGVAERMAPGVVRDMAVVGADLKSAYSTRYAQARKAASGLYDAVEDLVRDKALPATNLQAVAGDLSKRTEPMAGLASSAARKGASLAETLQRPAEPLMINGTAVDPQQIPRQLLEQMGINPDAPVELSFRALRDIQSAAGGFARRASNEREAGYFKQIYQAATDDLNAVRETEPRAGELLDLANAWYKREVIGRFRPKPGGPGEPTNKAVTALRKAEPSEVVPLLTRPGVSREMIDQARRAVGPDKWNEVAASWLEDVVTRQAVNPQTGEFSIQRFLSATSPQKYSPETLRAMVGNVRARDLDGLRTVLESIQKSGAASANPSETGRALLGGTQLLGVVQFAAGDPIGALGTAAGYAAGRAAGRPALGTGIGAAAGITASQMHNPDKPVISRAGMIVLTPPLLARVLFSPGGVRWLTEGLKASPGTQAGIRAASHIASRAAGDYSPSLNDVLATPVP